MIDAAGRLILRLRRSASALYRRRQQFKYWQMMWSDEHFDAHWLHRPISDEIIAATGDGWFPFGATTVDVGCGEGKVAAWMADHGFPSVGIDIAPAAISRARARFREVPGRLEFIVANICARSPPDRKYRLVIDRGCFHCIQQRDHPYYLRNLLRVCAPDARFLLFHRAYRNGVPMGDIKERERVKAIVEHGLGDGFRIDRLADTYLDPFRGQIPEQALGGITFWLTRI